MEKYKQDLGFYCGNGALSCTAGKILTALQSLPADHIGQNEFNQENVCNRIYNLEVKENVDHYWSYGAYNTSVEDQLQHTTNIHSFPSKDHGLKEQAGFSKECAVTTISSTSAVVSSCMFPDKLPVSAQNDLQPSTIFSIIPEQRNGQAESSTALVSNDVTLYTGHVSSARNGCQPCERPALNFPEHTTMKTFRGKKDKAIKGVEMILYNTECMSPEEQLTLLEEIGQAKALVLTMVFHNGSSQLSISKDPTALFKGILVLIKKGLVLANLSNKKNCDREDTYLYLNVGDEASWRKDQEQNDFIRKLVPLLFQGKSPGICFSAKDYLRSAVPVFKNFISWKKMLESPISDPKIAAWLLDPADSNPTFEDLVKKYCDKMESRTSDDSTNQQDVYKKLNVLYNLMESLQRKLQLDRLWDLFYTIERPLTTILADTS